MLTSTAAAAGELAGLASTSMGVRDGMTTAGSATCSVQNGTNTFSQVRVIYVFLFKCQADFK